MSELPDAGLTPDLHTSRTKAFLLKTLEGGMAKKQRKKKTQAKPNNAAGAQTPTPEAAPAETQNSRIWQLLVVFLIAYTACVGLRLLEFPYWQADHLKIQGEHLMATHDAYVWLAGAEEINRKTGTALSQLLGFFQSLTNFKMGSIGFWLPVIMGPLVVLPIVLLGWREKQIEAGIAAGIMAGGCLGFLLRTRFGFLDTDVLALFFPVAIACGLILWLGSVCRKTWRPIPSYNPLTDESPKLISFLVGAMAIGLLVQGYDWFYGKIHIAFGLIGLAIVIGLLLSPKLKLPQVILGFSVLIATGFGGWPGLVLGLVVLGLTLLQPTRSVQWLIVGLIAGLAVLLSGGELYNLFSGTLSKLFTYAKISTSEITENATLKLPSIAQSVREAQNVNWETMATRTAGSWWLFWPGLAGFAYLVYRRPAYLVWLPLLILGIGSVKLGNRFSMFGGAVIGVGLAFGLNRLLLDLNQPRLRRWLLQIVLCLLVIWPLWNVAKNLRPAPILPRVYAKTLSDLKTKTPENAQLWQWWDYGYAGQYYAHRRTFGDGGDHAGEVLYPLARVHSSHSPLQAHQLIKLVASTQQEALEELQANSTRSNSKAKALRYPGDPVQKLREMGPEKAQAFVQSLAVEQKDWTNDLPPQYLTFSWENLRLAYWISYYGNWNLVTGTASPGNIQRIKGEISFKLEEGKLVTANREIPLKEMDIVTKKGTGHYGFQNKNGFYAVLNKLSKELYLMDATIYKSLMVQMLLKSPQNFEEHFELVVNRFPWNRVYRIR